MRRMTRLLAGAFFTASIAGFAADLMQLDSRTLGRGLFWPVLFGATATALLVARIKRARLIPWVILLAVAITWLAYPDRFVWFRWLWQVFGWKPSAVSSSLPLPPALKQRVLFDAIGIWFSASLGLRLLLSFVTREGLANVRMQTELSLAHGIQATLVPTVSVQTASLEVYGRSIPSTEMGGDLIDVIESDGSLLAYVADISGHGLPAGQLMGMLKAALRVSFQFQRQPVALLESADRVLPSVKGPDMYATLALLYFDGSTHAEYASAGHVPILHYRHRTSDTVWLSMEQFPLGLIPGSRYQSQCVSYSPRDVFLILTDGITEVVNETDEEFGLARLELLLRQHAAQPLSRIWELIMSEVRQHGAQQDDQSLLLLRIRE
jgi:serine phosphatase RsbU (regulator of sigma subunit)